MGCKEKENSDKEEIMNIPPINHTRSASISEHKGNGVSLVLAIVLTVILLAAGCTFVDRIHGQRLPEYMEKTDAEYGGLPQGNLASDAITSPSTTRKTVIGGAIGEILKNKEKE